MNPNEHFELINEYLDWYEELLTDKQKEVMNLYYRENYSLSEIAENLEISKSAVSDLMKRVENTLHQYEKKLHLVQKFHLRNQLYMKLKQLDNEEIDKIVENLKESES